MLFSFPRRVLVFCALLCAAFSTAASAPPANAPNAPPASSEAAGKTNVSHTSWFGNTLSGKNEAYMVNYCDTLLVGPDSTVYTNTLWDEGGHEISGFRWNPAQKTWEFIGAGDYGHGCGGRALCANKTTLFSGQMLTDQATGMLHFGVTRRDLKQPNLPLLPWKTGGIDANARFFPPALLPTSPPLLPGNEPGHTTIDLWRQYSVWGLAATDTRLFVSVPGEAQSLNSIQVFDISHPDTITKRHSWRVPNGAQIAYDSAQNELWVLQNIRPDAGGGEKGRYVIRCFTETGTPKPSRTIAVPDGAAPESLAWDTQNKRLLVADNGQAQQILCWNARGNAAPTPLPPIGEKGGVYAGTTKQGDLTRRAPVRLFGPRAAACDAAGNIIVSEGGPEGLARLQTLSSSGEILHAPLLAAEGGMTADADPQNLNEVYSASKHYHFDYQKPPGKEAALVGLTANPFAFPHDPRFVVAFPSGAIAAQTRRINGSLFLFVRFDIGLGIYRFDTKHYGETAIPCGYITETDVSKRPWIVSTPAAPRWIWRDLNGNGKWDTNEFALPPHFGEKNAPVVSDLAPVQNWEITRDNTLITVQKLNEALVSYPLRGLDKWGSPIFDTGGDSEKIGTASPLTESALPAPFEENAAALRQLGLSNVLGGMVSRLTYNPATDTMFLCGYSMTYPGTLETRIKDGNIPYSNPPVSGPKGIRAGWKKNADYDGNPAGRLLAAYPRWSKGGRTASWVQPLPYRTASPAGYFGADVPNAIASAGRYVFVGYRYNQKILIYDAKTGTLQPQFLLPDTNIVGDNSGALDIPQALSATFLPPDKAAGRPHGEYLVRAQSNTRNRILLHRWKPNDALAH